MCLKSSVITSVKQLVNCLTNPQCVKILSSLTYNFCGSAKFGSHCGRH